MQSFSRVLIPGALALLLAGCGTPADEPAAEPPAAPTTATADPTGTGAAAQMECPPAEGTAERTTEFPAPPPMCLDERSQYSAVITTDAGEYTVDLLADKAPQTVNNFVFLARNKYYDGTIFHRVIPGFMNQGGDPEGTGMGGPGYTFEDELPEPGEYEVGSVAMANAGPDTNGSQFFTITGDAGVQLPPQYTLFGTVTDGMDVVHQIEQGGSAEGAPETTHTITSVRIVEEGPGAASPTS